MSLWRRTRYIILLIALLMCVETDGLSCFCTDCLQESICTVPDGGACYAQLILFQGIEIRRQRCYEPHNVHYCNVSTETAVIECCSTNFCNENLHPQFPEGSTEVTTPPPTTPPPTNPLTTGIYCYEYDSRRDVSATYCYTTVGCYRTERRNKDGTTRQKQGCSESCIEEDRNRITKICCDSTLCNAFSGQTPPPYFPTSPPNTPSGDGGSGQNPNEALQNYTLTEILASTASIPPTHVTSTLLSMQLSELMIATSSLPSTSSLHEVTDITSSTTPMGTQSIPQTTSLQLATVSLPPTHVMSTTSSIKPQSSTLQTISVQSSGLMVSSALLPTQVMSTFMDMTSSTTPMRTQSSTLQATSLSQTHSLSTKNGKENLMLSTSLTHATSTAYQPPKPTNSINHSYHTSTSSPAPQTTRPSSTLLSSHKGDVSPTSSVPPTHATSEVTTVTSSTKSSDLQTVHLSATQLPTGGADTSTSITTYSEYLIPVVCVSTIGQIILVILIIYICCKNKQLSKKNQYMNTKQSMDTLSSSTSV